MDQGPIALAGQIGSIGVSMKRSSLSVAVAVAFGSLSLFAAPAPATTISTEFFRSVDFSRFATYSWKEGLPAPNREVEEAIRHAVDEQMSARGFRRVDGQADLRVVSRAARDQFFPAGVLRIEISVRGSDELAWRGLAYEALPISDTPKKRQKLAGKAVKKLFKGFVSRR